MGGGGERREMVRRKAGGESNSVGMGGGAGRERLCVCVGGGVSTERERRKKRAIFSLSILATINTHPVCRLFLNFISFK